MAFLVLLIFLLTLYTAIELGKKNFVVILCFKYCDDAKFSKLIVPWTLTLSARVLSFSAFVLNIAAK